MKMSVGQTVEIIYPDQAGRITPRIIEICGMRIGQIRANCFTTGSNRVFLEINNLAWHPVQGQRYA